MTSMIWIFFQCLMKKNSKNYLHICGETENEKEAEGMKKLNVHQRANWVVFHEKFHLMQDSHSSCLNIYTINEILKHLWAIMMDLLESGGAAIIDISIFFYSLYAPWEKVRAIGVKILSKWWFVRKSFFLHFFLLLKSDSTMDYSSTIAWFQEHTHFSNLLKSYIMRTRHKYLNIPIKIVW